MSADPRAPEDPRAAVLRAYHLVEEVQTERMLAARAEIAAGIATAEPGSELRRTLLYADAVDSVVNQPERAAEAAKALIKACEVDGDPGLHAAGLGIRAETEVRDGDISSALHDTARASVLLERPGSPLARVSGLISVAETYGTLSLWELGDEMYDAAESLMPECEDQLLEPVTQINRAITRFWWAAALLEVGESPARGRPGSGHRAAPRRPRAPHARRLAAHALGQPECPPGPARSRGRRRGGPAGR